MKQRVVLASWVLASWLFAATLYAACWDCPKDSSCGSQPAATACSKFSHPDGTPGCDGTIVEHRYDAWLCVRNLAGNGQKASCIQRKTGEQGGNTYDCAYQYKCAVDGETIQVNPPSWKCKKSQYLGSVQGYVTYCE